MEHDEKKRHNAFEIRSLGELYQGRWEKKYWSSSRGKQRHPYPVGYHAVRTSSGHTYVMEIREGQTGPLFLVTCEEGISCTGATPNSAWEDVKKQHAGTKRGFAINGAEMFGFADPVVQFLLRELQASANGEARTSGEQCCSKPGPEQRNENRMEYFANKPIPFGSSVIREGNRKRVLSQPIMQLSWTPMNKRPRSQRSKISVFRSYCTGSCTSTSMDDPIAVTHLGQDFAKSSQGNEDVFEGNSSLAKAQVSNSDKQDEQYATNEDCLAYKSSRIIRSKAADDFEMSYAGDSEEIQSPAEGEPFAICPVNDKEYVPDSVDVEDEKSQHNDPVVHDRRDVPDSVEVEDEKSQGKDPVVHEKQYVPDSVESEPLICMPHKQYVPEAAEVEGAFPQHEKASVHAEVCSSIGRKKDIADPDVHDGPASFCAERTIDVVRGPVLENKHIPDAVDNESVLGPENRVLADGEISIVKDNESDSQLRFNSEENPSESDSLGQEVAKSMMSLLLPTAVPLLKRRSTQKREQDTLTRKLILDKAVETCRINEESEKQGEMKGPCPLQEDAGTAGTKLDALLENSHPEHPKETTREPDEKEDEVCVTGQYCEEKLPTVGKENGRGLADFNQGVGVASQQDLEYREFVSASKKLVTADGNGGPEEDAFNQGLVVTSQQDVQHGESDSGSKMLENLRPASIGGSEEEGFSGRELDIKAYSMRHPDQQEMDTISGKICKGDFERSRLASQTGLDQEDVEYKGFDSINKIRTISDMLEPVAAFEHPFAVMSVVINARSRAIDLCVCCGPVEVFHGQTFVYRVSVNKDLESEARLMQSLSLVSKEEATSAQQLERGIRFTPDGENLLVLGCFAFPQTSKTGFQTNVVRVVSLLNLEGELQLELASDAYLRCLLVTGSASFIAGGDGGYIKEWQMHCDWRLSQSETVLPAATYNGIPFRTISRLLIVPNAPHLVIGCDTDGSFATWDISKRQLLSSCHTSEYLFQNVQMVDLSLLNDLKDDQSCGSFICLLAEVTTANSTVEDQTFWTMVALDSSRILVGNKLDDRICTATVMGRYGVAGTSGGPVFLWEFSTGRRVIELLEQDASIVHIATDPVSAVLATVGQDGQVILYV